MAGFYRGGNRDQMFLMPVSMWDWLPEDHPVWFLISAVRLIDTSAFHARHPNDGPGRPAYDPEMMLTLLLYAYSIGLRSSRRIEANCCTDAALRVICGGPVPDHATIARFLVDHQDAIQDSFVEVVRLCAEAGLVSVASIAIDGTKISADAALDRNRSAAWIRAEVECILSEAMALDRFEAEAGVPALDVFGSATLPAELSTADRRLTRLKAAFAQIEAADRAEQELVEAHAKRATMAAAEGRRLRGSRPKEPRAALARAQADYAAVLAQAETKAARRAALEQAAGEQGRRVTGRRPKPGRQVEQAASVLEAAERAVEALEGKTKANVTDPDSRVMSTAKGWIQGYNAQAAVNEQQIVIACAVTQEATDVHQYQPMVTAVQGVLDAVGISQPIGVVLADAGYWSEANATADGPDRLIATQKDWKQRRAARELGTAIGSPPAGMSAVEAMEHRLRTADGAEAYALRSQIVEPVFGEHKELRRFRRFRRRGLAAVQSEWALMNASHNLGKLCTHHIRQRLS